MQTVAQGNFGKAGIKSSWEDGWLLAWLQFDNLSFT